MEFEISRSKKVFFALFAVALILSACVLPEKDPFEKLPVEAEEKISGEIFPFSVSVSTRATHRLEKDGRLVSYLASDIVRLDDFVGRKVELDGVSRKEKMREIFWVEKIKLLDLDETKEEIKVDNWFSAKDFAFIFPTNWEYSTTPDGVVHFLDKNDPARRVFFQFTPEKLEKDDVKLDPNVLISNLTGTKKVSTDVLNRERQEITLFSNLFSTKYTFVFTANFEEFEKKKDFFKLLNSFVEGEDNIKKAIEDYKKQMAEKESAKIEVVEKEEDLSDKEKVNEKEKEGSSFFKNLFKEDDSETEIAPVTNAEVKTNSMGGVENVVLPTDFVNLVDGNAFFYESSYYGFSMKVPYGFWFKNFGASEDRIDTIGFSDQDFEGKENAKFLLEIINSDTPELSFSEKVADDGKLVIDFPRSDKSFFRLSGMPEFRNAMKSIQATVVSNS